MVDAVNFTLQWLEHFFIFLQIFLGFVIGQIKRYLETVWSFWVFPLWFVTWVCSSVQGRANFPLLLGQDIFEYSIQCSTNHEFLQFGRYEQALFPALCEYGALFLSLASSSFPTYVQWSKLLYRTLQGNPLQISRILSLCSTLHCEILSTNKLLWSNSISITLSLLVST